MLPPNQQAFNIAAAKSNDEQLLLNMVRLHYFDRPYFLKIASINNQFSLRPSIGAELEDAKNVTAPYSLIRSLTGSLSYQETPTISYTPLQGSAFTLQVLEPMSVSQLYTLIRSGWSVSRALRVTTQSLGPLENAISASRPTSKYIPEYKDFIHFVEYLRFLERKRQVFISAKRINKKLVLEFDFYPQTPPEIVKLLRLKHPKKVLYIGQGNFPGRKDIIPIRLRSFIGIMYYLAKSVDSPIKDVKAGKIKLSRYPDGKVFNWLNVTRGILYIHSSPNAPRDANIKVYYRGSWFWIADSDNDSKQTMSLINQIYALQSDDEQAKGPVLTLPI